ncbi:RNase H-like domain found in reverse transcriptase [Popillia japonica]|uniref:RNase H-like domain found in reverse transcriptase n=1 Tax=Popillia japonica TaxID=7064 RepID=A0AAW1IA17_POPJA
MCESLRSVILQASLFTIRLVRKYGVLLRRVRLKISFKVSLGGARMLEEIILYTRLLNYYKKFIPKYYYKKFIPKYSSRTLPLNKRLRKGVRWTWANIEEEAFQELKNAFVDTLLLYHPQFHKEFIFQCDASHIVVAAELVQFQNGNEVPIHLISRTLKPTEIRYTIYEKEMLVVIFSVTKLRYSLLGKKFMIETDHITLTTMMEHKFTNGRLYRWSILLAEYDFEIKFRPGKHTIAAHHKHKGLFSRERLTISQNTRELKIIRQILRENPYKERGRFAPEEDRKDASVDEQYSSDKYYAKTRTRRGEDLLRKRIGKTLV